MSLAPNIQVGSYALLARLGSGGMGEIYLAKDIRLRRRVAIKVLPREYAFDHRDDEQLIDEALAAASLNHLI